MMSERTYFCIDMKCFYASVECAERGLNPFETNLVVADVTRGRNALCLAISPKLKALGVRNRCRLSEIPEGVEYIIAKPRMSLYIEYAADIYEIYLGFIEPADMHVYSIDETFLDVTEYLPSLGLSPKEFAKLLINKIAEIKHIPATAGIGTNLYLAKIALDITAKHTKDRMGYLDEELYKKTLWKHRPITDFWSIADGIANRIARYGIYDMEGLASASESLLYKLFGVNAELLIDHANGRESCTIADIKAYKGKTKSISSSQILPSDYSFDKARIVLSEMVLAGCQEMMRRKVITNHVGIYIGYSRDTLPSQTVNTRMPNTTAVYSVINECALSLFDAHANRKTPIRRLGISFDNVCDEDCEGYDLFTDFDRVQREKQLEKTVIDIKKKFGKNTILRGIDLQDGATAIERNSMIGGHNA